MMLSMAVDFVGGHFPIGCKTAEKSEWQGQIIKAWTSVNPASQNVMDALFGGYGWGRKSLERTGFARTRERLRRLATRPAAKNKGRQIVDLPARVISMLVSRNRRCIEFRRSSPSRQLLCPPHTGFLVTRQSC
ncbi:hypothetical protein [Ciceribacter sp. RN22]|uniref:hypothetical protein n=1 Tax=Ciceribacter sp. RN22 TaxID=2954932 RepID=UPI0020926D08|nr:hypothetical protein [Ciceribacter sp. RN22]MCO6178977.1 hypothetical protein [Ciceribacter sp. RN22]